MPTIAELPAHSPADVAGPLPKDTDALFDELFNTPLFMTSAPNEDEAENNDTLAALQSLVYDGNPDEIATNFKNQGNDCFKEGPRKYKDALEYYTKGLQAKSNDKKLNSVLYCNRAAVNLELKNYRRVLNDCAEALRCDIKNIKAYFRSAKALYALERMEEALDCCDLGLKVDPKNKALQGEREKIVKRKQALEELALRRRLKEEKKREEEEKLEQAIKARGIRMITTSENRDADSDSDAETARRPRYEHPLDPDHRVKIGPSGLLTWPVMFIYPEHKESDLIAAFEEDATFADHLEVMFGLDQQRPNWDREGTYSPDKLEIYFSTVPDGKEGGSEVKLLRVGKDLRLRDVLALPQYAVVEGVPRFFVIPGGSAFAKKFRRMFKSAGDKSKK
ncbi:hypothetical protein HK104_007120 [Borealophlyctis nickersoniae]|nr:hypothetical protein HK104_007120 [Borealophlyctis nickersoniae]